VGLGGQRAEEQAGGDLVVGQALGDQGEHLTLAVGQPGQPAVAGRRPFRAGGQVGNEPPGHARRQQRVASGHHAHRLEEVGRLGVLDQEAAGRGTDRLVEGLELGGARGRLGGVGVVGLAQHVQDGAQLPEPLLARGLDRLQGFGRHLGTGGQHVGGHAGLFGPVADGLHVGAPVRHRDPGDLHHGGHEREDNHATAEPPERVDCDASQAEHGQRPQPVRRPADAGLGGHRVQGDHRCHKHRAVHAICTARTAATWPCTTTRRCTSPA
jgi:hypothetical protein